MKLYIDVAEVDILINHLSCRIIEQIFHFCIRLLIRKLIFCREFSNSLIKNLIDSFRFSED